ncbi:MAG: DUF5686 and carboxypeptidase regulatory-like domain-containing protein [Clostridiales bacterium]|nr:DUF5686 and carboxypeptidase regulatory-like domain-containing protein [Clostridiales bacterium]
MASGFQSGKCGPRTSSVDVLVIDSVSGMPVPYAAIFVKGTGIGTLTDESGKGVIKPTEGSSIIEVSMMGYRTGTYDLSGNADGKATVSLAPIGVELNEVTVRKKRDHYSKRNNKAVQLMQRVRQQSHHSDPTKRKDYYTYDKYEKISLALNNYVTTVDSAHDDKNSFNFLSQYIDSSDISGAPILNVSVKEKLSTIYNRATPQSTKEIVHGSRSVGIDQIVDQASMQTFLNDVLREIDIYSNDVNILQNRFVSPLSAIGADFYKYYITDTIGTDADRVVELTFVPRVSTTFGFTGKMYIAVGDSSFMVRRATMSVPQDINLNFVDRLHLTQEYGSTPDGTRLKKLDDMTLELSVIPGTPGMYVRRYTEYSNHSFDSPEESGIFKYRGASIIMPQSSRQNDSYWEEKRPHRLTTGESLVGEMIDRLRQRPVYYWSEKILKVLVNGYVTTSTTDSKVDFGPVNTLVSSNDLEGLRIRLGGMTTANLSRRWFGRGYVAYGTKDKKFKYKGELEYSFIDKEYHSREFPIQSLRFTHMYDIDMIGQHYMFTNPDNVFLTWKRMKNRLITYHRISELLYTHEMVNNLTFSVSLKHERQESSHYVPFVEANGSAHGHYDETTVTLSVRYAPGEKFFQTKTYRIPVNLDAPVFMLEHCYGPSKFLGNTFKINRTEASVSKRFWFSAFGFLDAIVKGGHIWSETPYPSLLLPNANLSYTIQPESFALMDPMEFISDSYVSWDMTYWANGAILNYVPLIKRLKLREVFAFRGYLGSLSHRNKPSLNNNLYMFPEAAQATEMHGRPYMEASVGIDNLFKCLRVDYVWRITYRDTPSVDRNGLRIAFHMTF